MSNKDLLKQAIAEAKTIREAAIANAKEALEETLTPHLKEMLAQKLQEMEDADDMDESTINQAGSEDYSEDPAKHGNVGDLNEEEEEEAPEEGEEETPEEGEEGEEEEELEIEDMSVEDLKDLIRDIVAQETGHDEEAEIEAGEESQDDMTSVDDSEEIDINELLAELEGMDESSYSKSPKDLDKSGANDGYNNPSRRTPANSKSGNRYEPGKGSKPGRETFTNEGDLNEGFDWIAWAIQTFPQLDLNNNTAAMFLGALGATGFVVANVAMAKAYEAGLGGAFGAKTQAFCKKLQSLGSVAAGVTQNKAVRPDTTDSIDEAAGLSPNSPETVDIINAAIKKVGLDGGVEEGLGLAKESEELNEALKAVRILRNQLQEVNLLNAKLLYVNKVFKSTNLSEGQKVNVIAAFDKAETVKEVKLVFETVSKNVVAKPAAIKEHRSFASKATGNAQTTAPKEILSEVSEQVSRWQKLAGIIK